MKDSYKIIGDAVREFWKQEVFAEDVIVFFYQKYSNDKQWEQCQELAMCNSPEDFEHVTFLSDFCEGQTDVKNIHIKTLEEVTNFYYNSNYKQKESGELLDNIMIEIEQITDTMNVSYNRYVNLFNVRYIINKYKEVITNNE